MPFKKNTGKKGLKYKAEGGARELNYSSTSFTWRVSMSAMGKDVRCKEINR